MGLQDPSRNFSGTSDNLTYHLKRKTGLEYDMEEEPF